MRNLPNITSLRFFLALFVVLYHINQFGYRRGFPIYEKLPIFNKGPEAVSVFFSLSGFLIIMSLFDEKTKTGTISLKKFYKRRALRIFPLYYFVLIFGFCYYYLLLPNLGFDIKERQFTLLEGLLLGGTFFSNVLATLDPGAVLMVLWSIGIEEQFYLFIAPTLLLLPIKRILPFLIIFSVAYLVIYNSDAIDFFRKYWMEFYYFSVSGVVAILAYKNPEVKFPSIIKYIVYCLFALYFLTDIFKNYLSEDGFHLFSLLLFPIFIFCLIQKPYKFLEYPKIKYLGKISYGIYMLHMIVMQVTGFVFLKITIENPILFFITFSITTIILSIFSAHLSYKYFESFFLKYKSKPN